MDMRRRLFFISCFVHILIFAVFLIHKQPTPSSNKKILVKNYTPAPPPKVKITPQKKAAPIKKTTPPVKKSKPVQKKQITQKKAPSLPIKNDILKDLEKAFSNLEEKKPTLTTEKSLHIPKTVSILHQIETISNPKDSPTLDTQAIIRFLEEHLELPEKGAVKIQLFLNANGSIKDLVVLSSESQKNAQYLKNTLPKLTFPCFNRGDRSEIPQDFTIYFKNL